MVSAGNLFISENSQNPDAAGEWIKTYVNAENATVWMDEYGSGHHLRLPTRSGLVEKFPYFYPMQQANLNRAKLLPWTFAAFEAFFRNEGDFHQGLITALEMLDRVQTEWDEIDVPAALVELAGAQGLQQQ